MTEITNDWVYDEEGCYFKYVTDTYSRKVPVVGAENEYTPDEDAQAMTITKHELTRHRDHTDVNPVKTVRVLFVNKNSMLFRNNDDYDSMEEFVTSDEIGYKPLHYYAYGV